MITDKYAKVFEIVPYMPYWLRIIKKAKVSVFKYPEIHQEILNLLEAKRECLLPEEKHAVLLINEMAIRPGGQFDKNSGEIISLMFFYNFITYKPLLETQLIHIMLTPDLQS